MTRFLTRLPHLAAGLCLIASTAIAAPGDFRPRSKAMEQPTEAFDRGARIMEMDRLNTQLQAEHVALGLHRTVVAPVDPEIIEEIVRGRSEERRFRIGAEAELSVEVGFRDIDLTNIPRRGLLRNIGAVRGTNDGGFVWSASVRSPDAAALRVHIEEMDFPEGSELYVWTRDGMAFGPYTARGPNGNGEFWTHTVQGDEVILQIRHRGGEMPSFRIAGVGHITSKWPMAASLNPMADGTPACPDNAACVWDINCPGAGAGDEVATARTAVAEMLFASGRYYYICSGGLVADADAATKTPYFLTANHCISRGREASSLETFFDYVSPSCGNCGTFPNSPDTTGASIVSSNRTSDYTLLLLNGQAPSTAGFLGWNATPVAYSSDTLFRVSHPQGAPQSYSEHVIDTSKGTCTSWPRGNWIYSRDTVGATEGGSSGSPVVNSAGEIVGQLSGGCGTNVYETCDSVSNATVDGAFAAYFDQVSQYLDNGGGGCTDDDGDGHCTIQSGGDDCDDSDGTVYPGAPELCDGKDNNCDTVVDEGCGGGGCTDNDGDGHCSIQSGGDDCNDNDAHIYPGHPDKGGKWGRDGKDNDCDGIADNG